MNTHPEIQKVFEEMEKLGITEIKQPTTIQRPKYTAFHPDDYADMERAEIDFYTKQDTAISVDKFMFDQIGRIETGIREAWERAAELQKLANAEPNYDERDALSREAAAIRETLRTIFKD